MVLTTIVMAFLFLPLCVFLVDTALVEASYAQLGDTLQIAAEDGASMIDEGVLRASGGKTVVLDLVLARAVAERSIQGSGLPGLSSWTLTVTQDTVTASASVRVHLLVVGNVSVSDTRRATFAYGQ